MDRQIERRAAQIFQEAIEIPIADRQAFLQQKCGADEILRAAVEALLAADAAASASRKDAAARDRPGQSESDATQPAGPSLLTENAGDSTLRTPPTSETPGTIIGRYKLLELIGEGGFGSVWMAEQREPVKRRVALKIIKLGMDTRQVIARFEAERQALALMDHPNIAKVLDGGATEQGRPYFVMELVRGVPITEFCDHERLDTKRRLELFAQVCNAVQHAHTKGVIHRDIKPSNVLVTLHDGVPVPKVIDFGIAKATNAELTEKTLFTEHRQMIGTPAYMSPEQAEMSGLDIDTRSDVYSLGVLLYELLTGTPPFEPKRLLSAGYAEMVRIIREEEPPRPSLRLSSLGERLLSVSHSRQIEARHLQTTLRGDLDVIVMACLEKDRTRRYETASALAGDIRRHLAGQPIERRLSSFGYVFRKFVRRYRWSVAFGATVALLTIVSTIAIAVLYAQTVRAEQRVRQEARISEEIASLLVTFLPEPDKNNPAAFAASPEDAQKKLSDAVRRVETQLGESPHLQTLLTHALGVVYKKQGNHDQAIELLEKALVKRQSIHGELARETTETRIELGSALRLRGDWLAAEQMDRAAVAGCIATYGAEDPQTLAAQNNLASALFQLSRLDEAEPIFSLVLEARQRTLGESDSRTLATASNLAVVRQYLGRLHDAEIVLRGVVAAKAASLGDTHTSTLNSRRALVDVLRQRGVLDEAERLGREVFERSRQALGPQHPDVLLTQNILGMTLLAAGRPDEAEPLLAAALAGRRQVRGEVHAETLISRSNWACLLEERGRLSEAEAECRAILAARRTTREIGPEHRDTLDSLAMLGRVVQRQERFDEALAVLTQARDLAARILPGRHFRRALLDHDFARCLLRLNRANEATPLLVAALDALETELAPGDRRVCKTMETLIECYETTGQEQQANLLRARLNGSRRSPSTDPGD